MDDKFLKPYNPTETEARIAKLWDESGFFDPDKLPDDKPGRGRNGEPFSLVLPPPNVTGQLHMGSAFMLALEDIMVRHARMKGRKTLWIPGTDHAAIATQSKVEKEISKKEGKSRHDLGREELLKRIDAFAAESHDVIVEQVKKMGCSIDWSREAFTLDEKRNLAVRTAFKKMYDDGLIYRGFRVVNWDPKGQTTISDDEIVYEARKAKLYTFKYGKDTKTGEMIPISISTTRPETKLGDTAIAVHPDDTRYQKYIGAEYDAVFAGEPIHLKVIADQSVDPEFGTGALGVTPAHSQADWEMAQRHDLPLKQVINEFAKMMVGNDSVKGKKAVEAREAIVAWLREQGLLEKEEEIEQNISTAERTGGIVEPLPKLQWFIGVNKKFKRDGREVTLKSLMKEAVGGGIGGSEPIKIIPDRFEKVYTHWIENLRDWCISRQIWYGHRVPVWYKGKGEGSKEEIYVGLEAPTGSGWTQDEDTLDTWFSSGLWTFSTLGWPDEKEFAAHRMYHPTTILETGRDILFFWVARMILMSSYLLGEIPFKTVYLHGLVTDKEGKKISKSSGNNMDPLDLIAQYGADAVRMSLVVGVGPGNDSKISLEKVKAYKLFANKLWNVTRFILENTKDFSPNNPNALDIRNIDNKDAYASRIQAFSWLQEFEKELKDINVDMNNYRYYIVAEKLYHYAWHTFADKILEQSKTLLNSSDTKERWATQAVLLEILKNLTKALHPFMPFVTEEIWAALPAGAGDPGAKEKPLLMVEEWPV